MRIADITIPMFSPGSIHIHGLLLLLLLAQPLPAQLLHYSVETDKTHYVQDERVYIVENALMTQTGHGRYWSTIRPTQYDPV
jgi:hypothetical protein